ncbi:MAG TPA: sugar ABC transporter permease [Clostridiaceae bacterium]|jgi:putative aldouronate transport system permease protein|nr:sugar ABC transporter permease [Clostridiaceae bacterium]
MQANFKFTNTGAKFKEKLKVDLRRNKYIYLMLLPVVAYYIIFCYQPMYGVTIAFKNYVPNKGILGSEWVGFKHFINFFESRYFLRILKNTLVLSVYSIIFSFPIPIIFALLLNELRSTKVKKTIQTITYLPHFISLVIVCGMLIDFTSSTGLFNRVSSLLGKDATLFMMEPKYYRTIYIGSGIWQNFGWGSIIYIAAIAGVDQELYEASYIDGAGRLRQVFSVTIPGILPTIIIMLILRVGSIMSIGYEKTLLLYNSLTMDVADIISTFVYRKGLLEANYSYSAAVGLFNNVINCSMLVIVNKISRTLTENSLW